MHRYVRIDLDRLEEYRRGLETLVANLKARFRISRVILFGSFARDDVHERSDIDLVVVGELPGRLFERIGVVLGMTKLPIEPWVYTNEEWEQMLEDGNSFAEEVLETGVELR